MSESIPVDPSRSVELITILAPPWHFLQIKDEVANLAKELVLVDIPVGSIAAGYVRITIYQSHTCEIS